LVVDLAGTQESCVRWRCLGPNTERGTFGGTYLGMPVVNILSVICKEAASVMQSLATSAVATCYIVRSGGRGGRGGYSESQQRNKGVLVESQGKRTTFGDDSD